VGNTDVKLLSMNFSIAEWFVEGYILSIHAVLAPWLLGDSEVYIMRIPYKFRTLPSADDKPAAPD